MINIQTQIGMILIALMLLTGFFFSNELFFRLLIGFSFGFVLSKATLGFAGSINKLYRVNSASLAKALVIMFFITSLFVSFLIYGNENSYNLNIYPINFGLILGGLMFGVGMSFSSCCATGSLCDLSSGFSRALTTIIFFGIGVFLGFYLQGTASWIKESWITSSTGSSLQGGVFLPDLFKFDQFNGYLISILLTLGFVLFSIFLANRYEKKYLNIKNKKSNINIKQSITNSIFTIRNIKEYITYENIFIKNWNMVVGGILIAIIFTILLSVTEKGWSVTSAFGFWFAKILMLFGFTAESLSIFTTRSVDFFSQSIFMYSTSLQNFGLILGVVVSLLLARVFKNKFILGLTINSKNFMIYAFGGLIMGFGTRLSNGCNVGSLFTPIVEFSLSGWIYLIFVVCGAFAGNIFLKKIFYKK